METAQKHGMELIQSAAHLAAIATLFVKEAGEVVDSHDVVGKLADGLKAAGSKFDEYAAIVAVARDLSGDLGKAAQIASLAMTPDTPKTPKIVEPETPEKPVDLEKLYSDADSVVTAILTKRGIADVKPKKQRRRIEYNPDSSVREIVTWEE
jgi:hypothetical protein